MTGCPLCRTLRRLLLCAALAGTYVWSVTGAPPLGLAGGAWRALTLAMLAAVLAAMVLQLSAMRRRWPRQASRP